MTEKLNHARVPRRFYILTLLIFVPIFYCLLAIRAHWYGWAIAVVAFAGLVAIRRSRFWRGWHAPLCFTLAFLAAYAGLSLSRPRWDVSLPGQIGGGTVWLFTHLPAEEEVTAGMMGLSIWRPPEGYRMETVQLPASTMEALMPEEEKSDWAVLQLHGGAFVSGVNDLYRMMAVRYSSLAGGACVYTLNYRLWPQYPYPSQQNDAMDAWVYLTGTAGYAADHIFVVGDSAGGNLALSLTLRLRDEGRELPAGIVAMSPWADLSNSGPSHLYNATKDPSFGVEPDQWDGSTPVGVDTTYPDGLNAKTPYLSPGFGDYAGFPPMLLQAGDLEVLLSDSQMVYDNAIAHGVDCTLTVYPGMFHVFQGSLDLLPESRAAWEEVGAFLARVMGE